MRSPVVRWVNTATGDVKEQAFRWRDPVIWADEPKFRDEYEDGEHTALDLALGLVPDLQDAIDMARMKGQTIEVRVSLEGPHFAASDPENGSVGG